MLNSKIKVNFYPKKPVQTIQQLFFVLKRKNSETILNILWYIFTKLTKILAKITKV